MNSSSRCNTYLSPFRPGRRPAKVAAVLCACWFLPAGARAADYYVATTGDDTTGSGTIGSPWATIQKAADSMSAGDTCYIRGGNYHQETVIDNLDGTSGSPITFINYSDEVVTLDGSQPVGDLGATGWTQYSGNIYQTTLTGEVSQIFVDGEWMMLARWPNARFDDESAWTWDNWAQGIESLSSPGHEYDAAAGGHDLAASGLNMSNAMAVLNLGNFSTKSRVVTNHAAGVGNFMYDSSSLGTYKTVNHYYFFDSKLNLLDAETEWYFDPATSNLYLWALGGGLPTGDIRGKNMDNAFFISNSEYIQIKGLQLFAQTFRLEDCNNITVKDCDLAYPCFNKRTLGQTGEIFGTRIEDCTYITILNCSFAYTDGLVVKFQGGSYNTVENCALHHLDYTVAHHSGNSGFIWFRSSENGTFRRNTVYTTGASEGVMVSSDQLVELNDISDTGLLQSDGANVHLFQGHRDVDIVRNWFHNSRKPAIRLSDGPKDVLPAAPLMRTGRARSNVDFNSLNGLSFMVKGDERGIYNNLCVESIRLADDSGSPSTSGIHANSITANNAVGSWISHLPNSYGAPSGTHSSNWEGDLLGGKPVSGQLRDWNNLDFRPRANSDYRDAGTVVAGVTDGYLGAAPDIGPYEYGATNYWIAGRQITTAATPVPPNGTTNARINADLMWLEGYKSVSHNVYFGTVSANVESATTASAEFKGNQVNNIYDPAISDGNTYYWRIDAVTATTTNKGAVWSFAVDALGDTDDDGMLDGWETAHFGDLDETGAGDNDGDGATDLAEFEAGTEPTDIAFRLRSTGIAVTASGMATLTWDSQQDGTTIQRSYTVLYADGPFSDSSVWRTLSDNIPDGGVTTALTDDIGGMSSTLRSYLVRPAGYYQGHTPEIAVVQRLVLPEGRSYLGIASVPTNATLSGILGTDQLPTADTETEATVLDVWNQTSQAYDTRYWLSSRAGFEGWRASGSYNDANGVTPDLTKGLLFTIREGKGSQVLYVSGWTRTNQVSQTVKNNGFTVSASPFSGSVSLSQSGLVSGGLIGGSSVLNADALVFYDPAVQGFDQVIWYDASGGVWRNADTSVATRKLEPGESFVIWRKNRSGDFSWTNPVPYSVPLEGP